jgi:hypothetical protein
MSETRSSSNVNEPSAVDDLRRIRRRIDRDSHGDLRAHIAESNRLAEQLRERLGLKPVPPHAATSATPDAPA